MRKLIKPCLYIIGGIFVFVLAISIAGMFIKAPPGDVKITDKEGIKEAVRKEAKAKEATKDPESVVKEKEAHKDALENLDFMFDKTIKDSGGSFSRVEYEQIKDRYEADIYINDSHWFLEADKEARAEKIGEMVEGKFIGSGLVEDGDGVHVTIRDSQGDVLAVEDFLGGSYDIK